MPHFGMALLGLQVTRPNCCSSYQTGIVRLGDWNAERDASEFEETNGAEIIAP